MRREGGGCPLCCQIIFGLMLKKKLTPPIIIELVVILNHLRVSCDMNFSFLFSKKLPSCCLNKIRQSSKHCLKTLLSDKNCESPVKVNGISDGIR